MTDRDNTIICTFCDYPGHHVLVCQKKKQYKEGQAKTAAKRKVKKTTADEEDPSEVYNVGEEEEGASEEFLEEGSVNVIRGLDFPKRSYTTRGKV